MHVLHSHKKTKPLVALGERVVCVLTELSPADCDITA